MVEIIQVPPSAVAGMWSEVEPLLEPAIRMSRGCYEPQDVMAFCAAGGMQLWVAYDGDKLIGSIVTELVDFPRRRITRAVFAGGKAKEVRHWYAPMDAAVEAWGRSWGASAIMASGRKGWGRIVNAEEIGVDLWRDFAKEVH